ncbi:hypothetical protein StoSoilB20_12030 [Arthrobacter sp. StoSoilB20]|nr:hypothetical protein StoSoilB20_12030 [Arthrobacter sp. StoSoilB20]
MLVAYVVALVGASTLGVAGEPAAQASASQHLDPTFGKSGIYVNDFGGANGPGALATGVDAKNRTLILGIVATQEASRTIVVRLLPSGQADPAFGKAGVVDVTFLHAVKDLEVRPDGRVLLLGAISRNGVHGIPAVGQLNIDGKPDLAFGVSGVATLPTNGPGLPNEVQFDAFELATDGSILIAGSPGNVAVGVWRFSSTGRLAATFDAVNLPEGAVFWAAEDIDVDKKGFIIVAGGGGRIVQGQQNSQQYGSIFQFTAEGQPDTRMAGSGVIHRLNSPQVQAVASFQDGTLIATSYPTLVAYTSRGAPLDALTVPDMNISDLEVDNNNRVIVAGWGTYDRRDKFALWRMNADRTVDKSIGISGLVATDFAAGSAYMMDSAALNDGRVVAAGFINAPATSARPLGVGSFALARYDFDAQSGPDPAVKLDFNGDGDADVIARDTTGTLWLYPGNGQGGWLPRLQIGSGWNSMSAITSGGDFNGDQSTDVMARDISGGLWLYPGNGRGGWLPRTQIGSGWNAMSVIQGVKDFNGDGMSDVLARDNAGALWLYPGNGKAGWFARTQVGTGWGGMSLITSPGDLNGDNAADVLARDPAGSLWLYPGNGTGGWQAPFQIGTGWNVMTTLASSGDFDGDGNVDIVARDSSGNLWIYPRGERGHWILPRKQVGVGWNIMTAVL